MAGTRWSRLFAVVGVRPRGLPSIGACNFPIHLGNVNCVLQVCFCLLYLVVIYL